MIQRLFILYPYLKTNLFFMKFQWLVLALNDIIGMLDMPSKQTKVKTGRVPLEHAYKMDKEQLDVKQCVAIALNSKATPNKEKEYLLRKYISKSEALSLELSNVLRFINELKNELGYNELSDDEIKIQLFDDTEKAIQRTLDDYYKWKGTKKVIIGDFINSKRGARLIEYYAHTCDLTQEDFVDLLKQRVNESFQSTLD